MRHRHGFGFGHDSRWCDEPACGGRGFGERGHGFGEPGHGGGRRQRFFGHGELRLVILDILTRNASHGYELIKAIQDRTDGAFTFAEGTLYPVLHGLERDRLVSSYWDASGGARRRKYYQITPGGRTALASRASEWSAFTAAVGRIVGGESRGRA